jgi:hypothetical protein
MGSVTITWELNAEVRKHGRIVWIMRKWVQSKWEEVKDTLFRAREGTAYCYIIKSLASPIRPSDKSSMMAKT